MKKAMIALVGATLMAAATVAAAPAPALSYLQIQYVGSANQGWEFIPDSAFSTTVDHGGTWLQVVTVERGYGGSRIARFNGAVLPSSANVETLAFCSSDPLTPCSAGQTVVGYTRVWSLDGKQGGTFSYQSTSLNSPFNTMSDSLSIR